MREVARVLLEIDRGQRNGVLAAHVGEDGDVDAEHAPVAQRVVRIGVHEALIGQHGAGMDVDADEAGADRARHRQRGARVVLQHVDAKRGRGQGAADRTRHHGEAGHGGRLHAAGRKRRVAVVLDEHGVHAVLDQRAGVVDGGADDPLHGAFPARTAWQRRDVDHPDEAHARRRL